MNWRLQFFRLVQRRCGAWALHKMRWFCSRYFALIERTRHVEMWGKQARLHLCNGDLGYPSAGEIKSVPSRVCGFNQLRLRAPPVLQALRRSSSARSGGGPNLQRRECADEDCNGEKAAYEAALKKRNTPLVAPK
jgi:hypothetical protein